MRTELAVGDPARRRAGRLIIISLALAAGFAVLTVMTKETPALVVRQPWQDDPYDVPVSLDFVFLPLLVVIGLMRVQLCRRNEPLPARRLVDLQRVANTALAVSFATELIEWVAVALRRHRSTWTAATTWQIAALGTFTAATVYLWIRSRTAARAVSEVARPAAQPDWLADAVALGLILTRLLPRKVSWIQTAVQRTDEQLVARIRTHPVAAAGFSAVVLASPFVAAKIVLEGYPAPLVLLIAAFVSESLFVLVTAVGAYLRIVAPRQATPPASLITTLVACTAGAVAFAFHDTLLAHQTVAGLSALYFGSATAAAVLCLASLPLWRRRSGRPVQ